jgi:hypothetical protein
MLRASAGARSHAPGVPPEPGIMASPGCFRETVVVGLDAYPSFVREELERALEASPIVK